MKNKWFLISMLSVLAVSALTGCNVDKKEKEITDEMITKVIEASNPDVEVHVGEYESMINPKEVQEEDYTTFTSSSVLDAPRDYVVNVTYAHKEETTLQNVTNLMSNIVLANDKANIITIKDRGGNYSSNDLLTLSSEGDTFAVKKPGGYEYGEVYEIEINDAPYLAFEGKSDSIRTLTIEIEDDPNESDTYDEKVINENIINIDLDKVSNKKLNEKDSTYSFDYDGDLDLVKGQVFYVTRNNKPNKYLDFYGVYVNKEDFGNKKRITYTAPNMDQIYRSLNLKGNKPLDLEECETEILLNQDIATRQFKNSTITRALAKTALPYAKNNLEVIGSMLSNFKVRFDTSYVNNRVGFKMSAGIYNYKLADQTYLTFEIGYEKVTDYNVDFDVSVRTKWIFPVGVDYKIKCLEESDTAYFVKINVTKAMIPETHGPDETADQKFFNELADTIDKLGDGIDTYSGNQFDPSTSGTRTTWPILRVDCYYFAPATFRLQLEVYLDIGIQATGLFKKQIHNNKVDFCYTNIDSAKTDEFSKTAETSNWMIGFIGSVHIEIGLKASFSFSILGLYDYLVAQAYAEAFINASVTGMAIANITSTYDDTDFTGYICIDLALIAAVRVGIYFKILMVDKTISKLLYFEYVFRIKYENALEHWSTLSEDEITIDEGQTLSLDQTNVLWIQYFDSVTMQLREKKFGAKDRYEIFSGTLVKDKNWGKGQMFTYKSNDENLLTIDKDGVIHVKDGTPNEFTTTIKIEVSNWAGTLSDKTVTVHFIANDTKDLYCGDMYIGSYRPNAPVILPEGPKEYGKAFLYYSYNGTHYNVGEAFTMPSNNNATVNLTPMYRLLKRFDVRFFDGLGNVISDNRIMEFESATEPEARIRDRFMVYNGDYIFLGWDVDFSYITGNLDIHGIYMEVK
ncbi:MAG: hypothetical protein J5666_02670 [Bacilli bacterium]|nr:hypothetical protein [Bacilli bacterium]